MKLEASLGGSVEIDVCAGCRAFWFDSFETLRISAASTLELFQRIADSAKDGGNRWQAEMLCPRCNARLKLSHDRQRSTPFEYQSCPQGHGRFERFNDFLKEKNFVQPLTPRQLDELRRNVRMIHCSNCAASVDLVHQSRCDHCGSPLVLLDRDAMTRVAHEYQRVATRSVEVPPLPVSRFHESSSHVLDFDLRSLKDWLIALLRASR